MGDTDGVSEIHAVSIIRVEMFSLVRFCVWKKISVLIKITQESGRLGTGTSSGPVRAVAPKSCADGPCFGDDNKQTAFPVLN
jgi:hypothetical protein